LRRSHPAPILSALLSAALAGCAVGPGSGPSSPGTPIPANLTVFAAASLKDVFAELGGAYEAANPGARLTFSFDASSALEAQIEQGAPADVFASADLANAQKLVDAGLAAGTVTVFAANRLTVIVPTGDPAGLDSPLDLARPGVKVVAAGDAVPITKYADRLLAALASQPGYPIDFAARVRANVVSREDNVAAVVAKIELGEGDGAIVYATDAREASGVTELAVPDSANVSAAYGAVVVGPSRSAGPAAAFVAWLAGPGGSALLARHGFLPPP
jgi:molybdate transport system substrate-binding protein